MKKIFILVLILFAAVMAQIDRRKPPAAGTAPAVNLQEHSAFTLDNGLRVFVIENHKLPLISLQLVLDYDPVMEGGSAGYVSATGRLLRTGTKTRTKDMLDSEIDKLGASISTSESGVYASGLSKFSKQIFALTGDIVLNANLTQKELDKIRQQMISSYAASKEEPSAIAARVVKTMNFGAAHPYGQAASEKTYEAISLDDCARFYQTYFRPNIAFLAIVGDITPAAAKELVTHYFGTWEKADVPRFKYPAPSTPAKTRIAIVDRPASVQSVVYIGYPVALHLTNPDIVHARLMNTILGGGTFRLFNNLRETHGYTYGAYSVLSNDKTAGSFQASANVRNAVTDSAVYQILYEMRRMRDEPVPETELTTVKNYLTGNFAISLENPQTIANFAVNIARYGLKMDFYTSYLKELAAVSAEQVQAAARQYLLPDQANIIIVGKADDIREKMARFAPDAEIEYYDTEGKPIEPMKQEKAEGLSARQVIDRYLEAIGGKQALLGLKDKITVMNGKMQGFDIVSTLFQKAPNKFLMKRTFSDASQILYFDGQKGIEKSPNGEREISGPELEKLRFQSDISAMARLDEHRVTANLLSKLSGKEGEQYKIELVFPSGQKIIQYYDAVTWFKTREELTFTMPQGEMIQELVYSDYRDVSGMKFPFSIQQAMGSIKLELSVTKLTINTGLRDGVFSLDK